MVLLCSTRCRRALVALLAAMSLVGVSASQAGAAVKLPGEGRLAVEPALRTELAVHSLRALGANADENGAEGWGRFAKAEAAISARRTHRRRGL
jgi:hypothetical protein